MFCEFFNGLWTITYLFQQLQQFIDHFKTDTTLFAMTILGNILLHNVMGQEFLLLGKKQDSKFDDCVDVTQSGCNTIRMR